MKLSTFLANVDGDEAMSGVDVVTSGQPHQDYIVVMDTASGNRRQILVETILQQTWAILRAVITGERPVSPIYHVSRVVGYFSRIENWNQSKIGELQERRAGIYKIG